MLRAMIVMVLVLFTLGAYFAGVAPAIERVTDVVAENDAVESPDSPVSPSIALNIQAIMLVWGPLLFGFAGILYVFVYAIRLERFLSGGP
ncbi:hypothetical protein [Halomarina pelagica]|uniref:hypothetical protein n=1 Tax=Halomarina pelagica TaxID=2961599 RepID=UPI0020C3BD9C|nr:hypothetical protein [Halomarina sp. BND7]